MTLYVRIVNLTRNIFVRLEFHERKGKTIMAGTYT